MSEHPPKSDPYDFTRTVYTAQDDKHVFAFLIGLLSLCEQTSKDTNSHHEEAAISRQIRLRLQHAELFTIDFHSIHSGIKRRQSDAKPHYEPRLLRGR